MTYECNAKEREGGTPSLTPIRLLFFSCVYAVVGIRPDQIVARKQDMEMVCMCESQWAATIIIKKLKKCHELTIGNGIPSWLCSHANEYCVRALNCLANEWLTNEHFWFGLLFLLRRNGLELNRVNEEFNSVYYLWCHDDDDGWNYFHKGDICFLNIIVLPILFVKYANRPKWIFFSLPFQNTWWAGQWCEMENDVSMALAYSLFWKMAGKWKWIPKYSTKHYCSTGQSVNHAISLNTRIELNTLHISMECGLSFEPCVLRRNWNHFLSCSPSWRYAVPWLPKFFVENWSEKVKDIYTNKYDILPPSDDLY